jgi:hypothetical protein
VNCSALTNRTSEDRLFNRLETRRKIATRGASHRSVRGCADRERLARELHDHVLQRSCLIRAEMRLACGSLPAVDPCHPTDREFSSRSSRFRSSLCGSPAKPLRICRSGSRYALHNSTRYRRFARKIGVSFPFECSASSSEIRESLA